MEGVGTSTNEELVESSDYTRVNTTLLAQNIGLYHEDIYINVHRPVFSHA